MLLTVALCRLLAGACLAFPLAALLGESGITERVEGDRALFEAGGYLLLEVARLQGPALLATLRGLLPLLGAGLLLTALCNACLLVGLDNRAERGARGLVGRGLELLPVMAGVGAVTALGQAALLVIASIAAEIVPEPLDRDVQATLAQLAAWVVGALAAAALGGFSDVVKAALVRGGTGLGESLTRARRCLISRPFLALFGWAPYAVALAAAVLGAAELTGAIDVLRAGSWRIAAVFLVHQLVIVTSVVLRAAWYARALRFVATQG